MQSKTVRSNALLLTVAMIWGFAFVAQRVGMDYIGPFTYNGIRFFLGTAALLPLLYFTSRNRPASGAHARTPSMFWGCIAAGLVMFCGSALQQIGLVYTTAGKAGFITGLYVVFVPIFGLLWKQRPDCGAWISTFIAAWGLYLLSVTAGFTIEWGDLLVLFGSFFWAMHVLVIDWLTHKIDTLKIVILQNLICASLSMVCGVIFETIHLQAILNAAVPILYGGLMSVGIAYTLQVVGQKYAKPTTAAIILCLESVFAALGGWMILGEVMTPRGLTGCALMLFGMVLSQLNISANLLRFLLPRASTKGQLP